MKLCFFLVYRKLIEGDNTYHVIEVFISSIEQFFKFDNEMMWQDNEQYDWSNIFGHKYHVFIGRLFHDDAHSFDALIKNFFINTNLLPCACMSGMTHQSFFIFVVFKRSIYLILDSFF